LLQEAENPYSLLKCFETATLTDGTIYFEIKIENYCKQVDFNYIPLIWLTWGPLHYLTPIMIRVHSSMLQGFVRT
jgi:hypothetical protein